MNERRRRVPRTSAGWPGRYRFEQDPVNEWGECEVIDISLIGAGLELMGDVPPVPVGVRIVVEVATPAGSSVTLRLAGETRNVAPGSGGGIRVGIEFIDLSDTERSILDVLSQMRVVW
jgi:hypothetical protein